MKKKLKYFLIVLFVLAGWITADWYWPVKTNIRSFDPVTLADYDTEMWKSYYEKKPLRMFFQLAALLRKQYDAPFWRSNVMAYYAAKAAFDFKKGSSRRDYIKALPNLIKYYEQIWRLSTEGFDIEMAAMAELEWWIVHRDRKVYNYSNLETALQKQMSIIYSQPDSTFRLYAFYRTRAMQVRDEAAAGGSLTEKHWQKIHFDLNQSWKGLFESVAGRMH